jgi:hypothetical protein
MKHFYALSALSALLMLAGCGSLPPQLKIIEPHEADAFKKNAMAQGEESVGKKYARRAPTYIQPLNKMKPCKLQASNEQIVRSNFKVYWAGDCKNGFALGLGRGIAISDTHHDEEITYHHGTGQYQLGDSSAFYNFAAKVAVYRRLVNEEGDEFLSITELGLSQVLI